MTVGGFSFIVVSFFEVSFAKSTQNYKRVGLLLNENCGSFNSVEVGLL